MIERNVEINFYGDIKIINLCDNYDYFKTQISLNFSIDLNKMDYIKIFYEDDLNNKIYIDNINNYNQLLSKIDKHEVSLLKILISEIEKNNQNKENKKEYINEENKINYSTEILNSILDYKKNDIKKKENENEIIFKVMCSICKDENLKNIIYFCLRCNNYVCSKCFETIKYKHSHSFNIIVNNEQHSDIKEIYNNYNIKNLIYNNNKNLNNYKNYKTLNTQKKY